MVWTEPRTWVTGEVVTSALLNTHLRDNLVAIGPHVHLRKTADETVTSSTTLQNDDHFTFAIAASEVWSVEVFLAFDGAAAGDLRLGWATPSGATGRHGAIGPLVAATGLEGDARFQSDDFTNVMQLGCAGVGTTQTAIAWALVVNSTTAGSVTMQWAQLASSGTATRMFANSWLVAHRIAP